MSVVRNRVLAGRYRLDHLLRSGGMSDVWAADDVRLQRAVAVKLPRVDLLGDERIRRLLLAEARMAAQLSHPRVVAVYDTGEDDGQPFIVMELLSGRTLRDELARGPLSLAATHELAADLLAALVAAHRRGLAHCDVKPGNLLADDGRWKLADFGIARSWEATGELTAPGTPPLVVGTLSYLAPERLDGGGPSAAGDQYAAGVALYEALAGHPPVEPATPEELRARLQGGQRTPLGQVRPDAPAGLVAAIERAMAVDPADRFTSTREMADALAADRDRATAAVVSGTRNEPPTLIFPPAAMGSPMSEDEAGIDDNAPVTAVLPSPGPDVKRRPLVAALAVGCGAAVLAALLWSAGPHHRASAVPAPPAPAPTSTSTLPPAPTTLSPPASTAPGHGHGHHAGSDGGGGGGD
jgi:serine/threonine-protein kinase